jgi:hypothetical protein
MTMKDLIDAVNSTRMECVGIQVVLEALLTRLDAISVCLEQHLQNESFECVDGCSESSNPDEDFQSTTNNSLHIEAAKICKAKIVYIRANS